MPLLALPTRRFDERVPSVNRRAGPASEVSVRQYAALEFVLNDPIVVAPTGIETRVYSIPNSTSIVNQSSREECFNTHADWLGVGWANTMQLNISLLDDLVDAAEALAARAVLQASPTASFGSAGLQVWEAASSWCATWVRAVLSGMVCDALYDARLAEFEHEEVERLVAESRPALSGNEAAALPARLAGLLNRTLVECTSDTAPSVAGFESSERTGCIEEASDAFGSVIAGRVSQRVGLLRATGINLSVGAATPVDFALQFGPTLCADMPASAREATPEAHTVISQSVAVDLAYVLDGTVRGHVAPNRMDLVSPGVYERSSDRPLEAMRTGGAISDGVNAILVDDVQLSAVVRVAGESLLRYRQVISVGADCTPMRGHPCAYPTSNYRTAAADQPAYRTSSCQREAEHGGAWYDTAANVTGAGLLPSKPFQVLVRSNALLAPSSSTPCHAVKPVSVVCALLACSGGLLLHGNGIQRHYAGCPRVQRLVRACGALCVRGGTRRLLPPRPRQGLHGAAPVQHVPRLACGSERRRGRW